MGRDTGAILRTNTDTGTGRVQGLLLHLDPDTNFIRIRE